MSKPAEVLQLPLPISLSRSARERGAAIIEFALVIMPLLGLVYMLVSVAWMFFGWASLQEGVREGVRLGVTGNPPNYTGLDAAIKQQVQAFSFGFLNSAVLDASSPPSITVQYFTPTTYTNVTGQAGATVGGNVLKVTASMVLPTIVPIWQGNGNVVGHFVLWTPTVSASSSDCMEGTPASGPPAE